MGQNADCGKGAYGKVDGDALTMGEMNTVEERVKYNIRTKKKKKKKKKKKNMGKFKGEGISDREVGMQNGPEKK